MSKRLFHPTLDSFSDVPDSEVDAWADAGWRKTPKSGLHKDKEYPEVDSFPGYASIPVLEDGSASAGTDSVSTGSRRSGGSSESASAGTGSATTTT